VLIAERHISTHTFPEQTFVSADIRAESCRVTPAAAPRHD
jgi:S-adenosylmethionine/arginine decarboxylase-like enzyme